MKTQRFEKSDRFTTKVLHDFIDREYPKLINGLWQIEFSKPKRTDTENKTFHGWVRIISDETGQAPQEVYKYLCERYNPSGCTYFTDGRFSRGGTSEMNTKQFALFLTAIKADIQTELGIILPTKDDEAFNEFYSAYCQ